MSETTAFELVTPERIMTAVDADMVVIPGSEGLFGVLPRHAPLISTLRRGVVEIHAGGGISGRIMVDGGIADVNGTRCTVLVERAESLDASQRSGIEEKRRKSVQDGNERETDFLDAVLKAL